MHHRRSKRLNLRHAITAKRIVRNSCRDVAVTHPIPEFSVNKEKFDNGVLLGGKKL